MNREELINLVLRQIRDDIEFGDLTAIAELLEPLSDEQLKGYLPEVDQ